MAQSLNDFINGAHAMIDAFEKTWLTNHKDDPETFPLVMEDGDEGLWYEQLWDFENPNSAELHE